MSKVYILCKECNGNDSGIKNIIKVFIDHTKALKELYGYFGKKDPICRFCNYCILTKIIGEEDYEEYEYIPHFDESFIKKYITKDIWEKVIDELPEKNTLNKFKYQFQE